ncbi:hypothetical protein [Verrucomicrobium sp. BvORR034]|uniref:hypothetical protein n=1 Tax=Verrucomicrobium sp. BvORR034 TaxID=1396418 RepID=UPI0006790CDF|nr:hypothetical protein [Verrucomicrobium sp. BvORR034]
MKPNPSKKAGSGGTPRPTPGKIAKKASKKAAKKSTSKAAGKTDKKGKTGAAKKTSEKKKKITLQDLRRAALTSPATVTSAEARLPRDFVRFGGTGGTPIEVANTQPVPTTSRRTRRSGSGGTSRVDSPHGQSLVVVRDRLTGVFRLAYPEFSVTSKQTIGKAIADTRSLAKHINQEFALKGRMQVLSKQIQNATFNNLADMVQASLSAGSGGTPIG